MKELLPETIAETTGTVVDKLGGLVDRFVRTKDEKAEFEKEMTEILIEMEAEMEKNVTERWNADMASDSWLSKNVRPLVLIFLIVNTMILIFIEAGVVEFNVKQEWISLLQLILTTVIASYFGGRSYEKVKIFSEPKQVRKKKGLFRRKNRMK
tara:strand:- start:469 stop:927 length:459 start_codon:yes stop_codon:yes gene_type:complete